MILSCFHTCTYLISTLPSWDMCEKANHCEWEQAIVQRIHCSTSECLISCSLHTLPQRHPHSKTKKWVFPVARTCLKWTLSCSVQHLRQGKFGQCPKLILSTLSGLDVGKFTVFFSRAIDWVADCEVVGRFLFTPSCSNLPLQFLRACCLRSAPIFVSAHTCKVNVCSWCWFKIHMNIFHLSVLDRHNARGHRITAPSLLSATQVN